MTQFSVLMSLYAKEKPEYLRESLKSVLDQTIKPSQIVVVKDGPLTDELESVLFSFAALEPKLFTFVPLEKNQGLGLALREGLLHCNYEFVARMDTDDIARSDRFELQLKEFENNPDLDICGSHVLEFEGTTDNIVAKRRVPLIDSEIKKYQKRRDAFNHPAVMFKKSKVLESVNYQSCPLMEDTYLWVNMFLHNAKAKNIDDYLLYFRVGKDMFNRRGGWKYYKKYKYHQLWCAFTSLCLRLLYLHYPILQKHKWLTPIMEVRRWGKLIFCGHLKRSVNELKYNNSISGNEAAQTQAFLKNVGL